MLLAFETPSLYSLWGTPIPHRAASGRDFKEQTHTAFLQRTQK